MTNDEINALNPGLYWVYFDDNTKHPALVGRDSKGTWINLHNRLFLHTYDWEGISSVVKTNDFKNG